MGGQACVLYGAAQFSKDIDLAVAADSSNLDAIRSAFSELQADPIAVPPLDAKYLEMGLAVHFRVRHPQAAGWRVDLLSKMRNVDPMEQLWDRRTTIESDGEWIDLLALPDLVFAKKTQRDKVWPMIARLVEANFFQNQQSPSPQHVDFWFHELRSPDILTQLANAHRDRCEAAAVHRPLLQFAINGDIDRLHRGLLDEQLREQELDRQYWMPLRKVLEQLRQERRQS